MQLYAVQHRVDNVLAFYTVAIINGTGIFGRILGNYLGDVYGPLNIQVPCTFVISSMVWSIIGVHNGASLVVVSTLYGITSGAWLSLAFAVLASLSRTPSEIGSRSGLTFTLSSIGALVSGPIQGALLTKQFDWTKPIAFAGVS
jgi:hypothetical protein